MKKIIFMMLLCVVLAGCDSASVGIIGGADGPTAVYVGKELAEGVESVRMIKADGYLWYDTGEVSENTPRCGTMDGSLETVGSIYDVPKENGHANFAVGNAHFGYQSTTGITKEVPIDGEWVIFKKIDAENLDKYRYCFYINGRLPNAVKDWDFVVLTNDMSINFEKVTKPMYSSSMYEIKNAVDCHVVFMPVDDEWGVSLTADNVTNKGMTLVCEQFAGNPTGELQTGDAYVLEINVDGEWKAVAPVQDNYAWKSIAYAIHKNEITNWMIDWEWLYGKLPEGYYRIGKEINDFRGTGDYDTKTYYAEFTIE